MICHNGSSLAKRCRRLSCRRSPRKASSTAIGVPAGSHAVCRSKGDWPTQTSGKGTGRGSALSSVYRTCEQFAFVRLLSIPRNQGFTFLESRILSQSWLDSREIPCFATFPPFRNAAFSGEDYRVPLVTGGVGHHKGSSIMMTCL